MSLAKIFPAFLERVKSPAQVMVGINLFTSEETPPEGTQPDFKTVTVTKPENVEVDRAGLCKALMLQIMAGLVYRGNPILLRVEWRGDIEVNTDLGTASVEIALLGHPEFLTEPALLTGEDVLTAVRASGVTDHGESPVWTPDAPDPKVHTFIAPAQGWAAKALYVSLMLELYDNGAPFELETMWRRLPEVEYEHVTPTKRLWKARARAAVIKPRKLILTS